MAQGEFWQSLLDSISGQSSKELIEKKIEYAKEIAIAQADADAAKYTPEALEEKRKLVVGVAISLSAAAIIIAVLYYKFK